MKRNILLLNDDKTINIVVLIALIRLHRNNRCIYYNEHNFLLRLRKKVVILCEKCNKYRALQIHHINRDRKDNRLDNLELLCTYCHKAEHNYKLKPLIEILRWNKKHYSMQM